MSQILGQPSWRASPTSWVVITNSPKLNPLAIEVADFSEITYLPLYIQYTIPSATIVVSVSVETPLSPLDTTNNTQSGDTTYDDREALAVRQETTSFSLAVRLREL